MLKNKFLWAAVLLLFVVLLSDCGQKMGPRYDVPGLPDVSRADLNGRLTIPLPSEPQGFNPLLNLDQASTQVQHLMFQGLVRLDKDLTLIPELAERYEISSDGKRYTFYLRKDVQWHDGAPFTAEDVVFTYDSVIDEGLASPLRERFIINGQPVKFTLLDRYTVRATLPEPFSPFLASLTTGIIPKHLLDGKNIRSDAFNRRPIGTGPFMYYEWQAQSHVSLLANKTFYRGAPLTGSVIYLFLPKDGMMNVAVSNGNVDSGEISLESYLQRPTRNNLVFYTYDGPNAVCLGFNMRSPLFSDKRVRQALSYLINKEGMTRGLFGEFASPIESPFAPSSWAYPLHAVRTSYDVQKAKKLLQRAGWSEDERSKLLMKDGRPFYFTLMVRQDMQGAEKAAQLIAAGLVSAGIQVSIAPMNEQVLKYTADPKPYDAVLTSMPLGTDPDVYGQWHSSQYPSGGNVFGLSNKAADRLLEKGRTVTDMASRKKLYAKFARILADERPCVFLWDQKIIVAANKRVGGYTYPSRAGMFIYPEKAFVVKQ